MSEPAETTEKPTEEQPTEVEKPAEAKPAEEAKPPEAKIKKKKSKRVNVHYKVEEGKLKRMLPFCERCGPGYFMANHGDRFTCGHCGFTRYKPAEKNK